MHGFPRRRRELSAVVNYREQVQGSFPGHRGLLGMSGSRMGHELGMSIAGSALASPEARTGGGSSSERASTSSGRSSRSPHRSTPGDWVARSEGSPQSLPGFCSARIFAQRSSLVSDDPRPPRMTALQPAEEGTEILSPTSGSGVLNRTAGTSSEEQSPVVVNRSSLTGKGPEMSPGFQSVAALAGWDFHSLLLATLQESDEGDQPTHPARSSEPPLQRTPDPGRRDELQIPCCGCGISICSSCVDRKRVERTPGHAITPASANRRHRRHRTQLIDQSFMELPLIGRLNLSHDLTVEDGTALVESESGDNIARGRPPLQAEVDLGSVEDEQLQGEDNLGNTGLDNDAKPSEEKKTQGPGQLACMDQLRDELSCAVCLDICFEPTTTSCGHSFCKNCLKSSIDRCGSRCPKCRQFLRGEVKFCPLNTTLWNTIQLLFPAETSARMLERSSRPTEADTIPSSDDLPVPSLSEVFLSTAVSRAVRSGPWRNPTPPLRPPPPPPPSFLPPLSQASLSASDPSTGPMRYYFSTRRTTRSSALMQEQEDFLYARRLQNEERRLATAREDVERARAPTQLQSRRPLYEPRIGDRRRAHAP